MTAFWLPVTRYGKALLWESIVTGCVLEKNCVNTDCFIKTHGTLGTCLNSKLRGLD